MKSSGLFITGTDTGVGKTLVTAALFRRLLREENARPVVYKTIQTGCSRHHNQLLAPDAEICSLAAAGIPHAAKPVVGQAFPPACSPHLAAELTCTPVDEKKILATYRDLTRKYSPILAEGAGGILVPLGPSRLLLDLMQDLAIPVLLVAPNRLGMINHTLLSLQALRYAGLKVNGVILNHLSAPESSLEETIRRDNRSTIERFGQVPVMAELPWFSEFNPESPDSWDEIENALSQVSVEY